MDHVLSFRALLTLVSRDHPKRPFLIDLDSANGTIVNDEMIPPSRYYELKSNDGAFKFILSLNAVLQSIISSFVDFGFLPLAE